MNNEVKINDYNYTAKQLKRAVFGATVAQLSSDQVTDNGLAVEVEDISKPAIFRVDGKWIIVAKPPKWTISKSSSYSIVTSIALKRSKAPEVDVQQAQDNFYNRSGTGNSFRPPQRFSSASRNSRY